MELRKNRNARLLDFRPAIRRLAEVGEIGGESVADVDARRHLADLRERDPERDLRLRIDLTFDHRIRELAVEIRERRRRLDRAVALDEREPRRRGAEWPADVDTIAGFCTTAKERTFRASDRRHADHQLR